MFKILIYCRVKQINSHSYLSAQITKREIIILTEFYSLIVASFTNTLSGSKRL